MSDLTEGLGGDWAFPVPIVAAPVQLYNQLRGAYGRSRFSALRRLIAVSFFMWIVPIAVLQSLQLLGAF